MRTETDSRVAAQLVAKGAPPNHPHKALNEDSKLVLNGTKAYTSHIYRAGQLVRRSPCSTRHLATGTTGG